ncbi:MAG: GAF domain-containing protein [Elusimicrobia bacterium]|nr:GAF domain-containing protein [Elusimicrobiota bacterium]
MKKNTEKRIIFNNNIYIKYFIYSFLALIIIGLFVISSIINPHSIPNFIASVCLLWLSWFVYNNNRKSRINRIFAFTILCFAVINIDVYGFYIANSVTFITLWVKVFRNGIMFIAPSFLHFSLIMTENRNRIERKILYTSYGLAIVFTLINWFGGFNDEFVRIDWKYVTKSSTVYLSLLLNLALFAFYSLFVLIKGYRKTISIRKRTQIRYVFLAGAIALVIGFVNLFSSFGIKVYPFGSLGYIAFTSIIAYAIVKHQLMDIEVIIRKGVFYASLTASITVIYAITVGISNAIFGIAHIHGGGRSLLIEGLAAMIIAISFLPLRNKIQLIVDKLFFREKHDYYKTLREFSGALRSVIGLDKLLDLLINTITETIHIDKASLMLLDRDTGRLNIKYSKGLDKGIIDNVYFKKDDYLPKWLRENRRILILEGANLNNNILSDDLRKLDIAISIPLLIKDKLIGIFNLGSKMSEDTFNPEDLELLLSIADQAAVAIENARLYEEMRDLERGLDHADKLAALGALASSIAHEIKNPLVSVKTFTQLVPRKFGNPDFLNKFNNVVPQELERLENVLEELLSFGRNVKTNLHSIKIENIIDNLLLLMQREASKRNIRIVKKYDTNIPEIVSDDEQLKQVFMNIVLNAIQAMPNGGNLTIVTSAQLSTLNPEQKSDFIEIRFSDTGCGISKENIEKVFKTSFTTKASGTGLGLAISQKIIKELEGTIRVESEVNKGTTFIVELPINS